MKKSPETLGKYLKQIRQAPGISQEELAHQIDRSVFTVSNMERGKGFPAIDTLAAMANYYQMSMDELIQPLLSDKPVSVERSALTSQISSELIKLDHKALNAALAAIRAVALAKS